MAGALSCLFGGAIADKYESKSLLSKGLLCMSGSILSIPFLGYGLLYTENFHISLFCYAL